MRSLTYIKARLEKTEDQIWLSNLHALGEHEGILDIDIESLLVS
jgi:hypothetical protein